MISTSYAKIVASGYFNGNSHPLFYRVCNRTTWKIYRCKRGGNGHQQLEVVDSRKPSRSIAKYLSELSFQYITSLSVYLKGNYQPIQNLTLFGYYQQGRTIRGRGRDVDYQFNNRQNAIFDEIFESNEGTKTIVNTGASYSFLKLSVLHISASLP